MKVLVIAIVAVALLAGPALAGTWPLLIKQLSDAAGNRLDATAAKAKDMIAEARKLHDTGKHAESIKMSEEAANLLGVKLQMKK